ncbi:hypothetical protein V8C86DRAFT_2727900 [Haematococcus lacustris]
MRLAAPTSSAEALLLQALMARAGLPSAWTAGAKAPSSRLLPFSGPDTGYLAAVAPPSAAPGHLVLLAAAPGSPGPAWALQPADSPRGFVCQAVDLGQASVRGWGDPSLSQRWLLGLQGPTGWALSLNSVKGLYLLQDLISVISNLTATLPGDITLYNTLLNATTLTVDLNITFAPTTSLLAATRLTATLAARPQLLLPAWLQRAYSLSNASLLPLGVVMDTAAPLPPAPPAPPGDPLSALPPWPRWPGPAAPAGAAVDGPHPGPGHRLRCWYVCKPDNEPQPHQCSVG